MPKQNKLPELDSIVKKGLGESLSAEYEQLRSASTTLKIDDLDMFAEKVHKQIFRLQKFNGEAKKAVEKALNKLPDFLISMYIMAEKNPQTITAKLEGLTFTEVEKAKLIESIPQAAAADDDLAGSCATSAVTSECSVQCMEMSDYSSDDCDDDNIWGGGHCHHHHHHGHW